MIAAAKALLIMGAFYGLTGVALGAFGAHALRSKVAAPLLHSWETGVLYQLVHALARVPL